MAKKQRTAREALVEVLKKNGGEMQAKDIIDKAIPLATGLTTDTRRGTLYGTLREEVLKPTGKVVKVGKGVYRHKTDAEIEASAEVAAPPSEEAPSNGEDVQVKPDPRPTRRTRRSRSTSRETAAV